MYSKNNDKVKASKITKNYQTLIERPKISLASKEQE